MKNHEAMLKEIKELIAVQGAHGNWNYDAYMMGMYNGMELIRAVLQGEQPAYRAEPDAGFLSDPKGDAE